MDSPRTGQGQMDAEGARQQAAACRGRVERALSTVLQAAVERGYLEKNPAHGIRIRGTDAKTERRFYSIEVAETFSDGRFGSPKTRSSNRVIPMSSSLRDALNVHRTRAVLTAPDDLVFCTSKGTPLNSKNLYNRALAPACDRIKQPRVSWHSFRHTHATQLAESGESLKTAQALLGHSDLETTFNTYMHVIPASQRRAVEQVAGVLFSDVLKSESSTEEGPVN